MRPERPPRKRLPARVYLATAVNLSALGALTAPAVIGLPAAIDRMVPTEARTGALAAVVACGAVAAVFANPLFGALSDRTHGRWGRRAPWLVAGSIGGAVAIVGLLHADSLAALTLWWVLAQILYNATFAAAPALMADGLVERQRARSSGVFSAGAFLGTLPPLVLVAVLPAHVDEVSLVMPGVTVAAAVVCVAVVREGGARRPTGARWQPIALREAPGFAAIWVQRLLVQLAFSLFTSFTLYFVMDRMSAAETEATPIVSVATVAGSACLVVGSAVAGRWAARRGGYLPFLGIAIGALAVAGLIRAGADGPAGLWASAVVGGAAIGVFTAVDLALALRTIPAAKVGTYLGMLNVAETVPQVVARPLAAGLLAFGGPDPVSGAPDNYATLLVAAAATAVAALAPLPFLRRVARPVTDPAAPRDR